VKTWSVASRTEVKLTLKDDLKWQDEKPVTANDICFTIDAMLNPKTASPRANVFREFFKGCKVDEDDDLSALIEFTQIFYKPKSKLNFSLLPAHKFKSTAISPTDRFGSQPWGSGAFKGGKGKRGAIFKAHRKSKHHSPRIDSMNMKRASDPAVQIESLRNGDMHGIISVAPSYRPDLSASSSEVSLKTYDLRSWWFIALNTNNPILKKQEVREALNLIIDREDLREKIIGRQLNEDDSPCEFISGPFVPASSYYNRVVPVITKKNLAAAKSKLKRAGLKKERSGWTHNGKAVKLRIGMKASLNREAEDLLDQIGNQLGAAGINREVFKIGHEEWTNEVVTGKSAGKYDLVIGKWSFNIDENVNEIFHSRSSTTGSRNIFNYKSAETDAIIEKFDAARTVDAAKNAYHELHAHLSKDLPYLFLWKLDTRSAWRVEITSNIITPYYYFTAIDDWKYRP